MNDFQRNIDEERISDAVIRRLPKYFRYLRELENMGEERVSSSRMSRELGLNASQIRRDLNCFGGFGQQGYGYSVAKLRGEIQRILGLDQEYGLIIVGAGNIGQALMRYQSFQQLGFIIQGVFDVSPELVGTEIGGIAVRPIEELKSFALEHKPRIGVICTPKSVAQKMADLLVSVGVSGIWNFAPTDVLVRKGVSVENVRLNDSLFTLTYRLNTESIPQSVE